MDGRLKGVSIKVVVQGGSIIALEVKDIINNILASNQLQGKVGSRDSGPRLGSLRSHQACNLFLACPTKVISHYINLGALWPLFSCIMFLTKHRTT